MTDTHLDNVDILTLASISASLYLSRRVLMKTDAAVC